MKQLTYLFLNPKPIPTVAQRALELHGLHLPGAVFSYSGRALHFEVGISPGTFGRLYQCMLKVKADGRQPEMIVLNPKLDLLRRRHETEYMDSLGFASAMILVTGMDCRKDRKSVV